MKKILIPIKRLPHSKGLNLPTYATALSSGADVVAAIKKDFILPPGDRIAVPSGISVAIPKGYEIQVRPRSGLAIKHGITCLNAPGTIDADYRGEIFIILINHGKDSFEIKRGMRIAQFVLGKYKTINWREVRELSKSERGENGLGSTGA